MQRLSVVVICLAKQPTDGVDWRQETTAKLDHRRGKHTRRSDARVWYDRQGPAGEVLHVGELPDPEPGPGEVRVRVRFSGVNPGDTKKRRGWLGSAMPYPRVIPHSDAAGVIDSVGDGVDPDRVGQRVWVYGAQSYRPFGTAAQYTVVPRALAVDLPDDVPDEVGACLGIPGITAHRAVFGDGPVDGATVLVHGVLGGVGSLAAQLARWGGATVIGTVRRSRRPGAVDPPAVDHVVALDRPDPGAAIRAHAPDGVDRIIEVAFSDNVDLDAAVAQDRHGHRRVRHPAGPTRPPVLAHAVRQRHHPPARQRRLPGTAAKQQAAADLTAAARDGALSISVGVRYRSTEPPKPTTASTTDTRQRVLLAVDD